MILVLLVYYLPYSLFALRLPAVILAVIAFSLYTAAYLCDIFLSGFNAVDQQWINAAKVLGLNHTQILFKIKLPIAIRAMLPAMLGLGITVFKDTSVLVVVAVGELTYSARQLQTAEPVNYALVMAMVILMYFTIATSGAAMTGIFEKKWNKNPTLQLIFERNDL